LLHKTVVP